MLLENLGHRTPRGGELELTGLAAARPFGKGGPTHPKQLGVEISRGGRRNEVNGDRSCHCPGDRVGAAFHTLLP